MRKKNIVRILCALMACLFCAACRPNPAGATEKHPIPYPEDYDTLTAGASSYDNSGDHFESPYFQHPDFYNMESTDTLTILSNYKTYQQTTEYHCGPAAALTVLHHFGITDQDELSIGEGMQTHRSAEGGEPTEITEMGTTIRGMAEFFTSLGWQVESSLTTEPPFEEDATGFSDWIIASLRDNTPILVEWSDWAGHWQAIIGYDTMGTEQFGDDVLILADPYDTSDHWQDGYYIFSAERFFFMWYDTNYQPEDQQYQQWVIAKL